MHPEHHSRRYNPGGPPQASVSRHWRRTGALVLAVVTAVLVTLLTLALLTPPGT